MGREGMKKGLLFFRLLAVCLLLAWVCGCGSREEGNTQKGLAADTVSGTAENGEGLAYVVKHVPLDGYCASIRAILLGGGQTVYFVGEEEGRDMLYCLEIGEEDAKKYPLELDAEEGMQVSVMGEDTEGNLLLGMICYKGDMQSNGIVDRVQIRRTSKEGKTLEIIDTGSMFRGREAGSFYIGNLLQDREGNYYLSAGQEVCVLRPDGSVYLQAPVDGYIKTMFALEDGRVVAGYDGRKGWRLEEVDLGHKKLKPLESSISFGAGVYRGKQGGGLVYAQDGTLYACSLAEEEAAEILHWMDYAVNGNALRDFMLLPDGGIAAVTVDYSAGAAKELSILTKRGGEEMPEKEVLVYAALETAYFAQRDIAAFNKQSGEYRIEVRVYGDETMEYGDRAALLYADLTGSQPPDMVDLASSGLAWEDLASAGVAQDLTPYLERDDSVNREDFLENVFAAYERDGKLYGIMPSFGIRTLAGKVADVGERSGWTAEGMMELLDSKGRGVELLPYADKGTALWLLCRGSLETLLDWEKGTCAFTGGEFEKLLEYANRFPDLSGQSGGGDGLVLQMEKVRDGRQLLLECVIASVELYQIYEQGMGGAVNFIGYPTAEGGGHWIAPKGTAVAMHAASEKKEGVWEFIRFCLSEEKQRKLEAINGDGFPVRKAALEELLQKEMDEEYYEDRNGNRKRRPKSTWAVEGMEMDVYAATREQVEKLRGLIGTAQMEPGIDSVLLGIIYEEAQAYFRGSKSPGEVAMVVQNRVQTYLDER